MSTEHNFGNRITANAGAADDGKELIRNALVYIQDAHGIVPTDDSTLFTGVYYNSQKVGSVIVKAKDAQGAAVVVKLQLRPLPYDEGFIIRHLEQNRKVDRIRPVKMLHDKAWGEELGFGYVVFEDISHLPNIWGNTPTHHEDRLLHKKFIDELHRSMLPIANPWIDRPPASLRDMIPQAFAHFQAIAAKSAHHHIGNEELKTFADQYFAVLAAEKIDETLVFTHGHLSGYDVKYDEARDQFVLMANLYWSWRPVQYDLVFPIWVDVMQIRDAALQFPQFLERVMLWRELWQENITNERAFWLMLLDRAMHTIMLDLGASEWKSEEVQQKHALLESWKAFFHWIIANKLSS